MGNHQVASSIDLASLAMRARDAYEQKRTKECLTLTRSLLVADPENAEGRSLQAAIRSDIRRNLDDARALLEDSRRNENLQEHRKAAEILLLKILYLEPDHEEAKALLNSSKGGSQSAPVRMTTATPIAVASAAPVSSPVFISEPTPAVSSFKTTTSVSDTPAAAVSAAPFTQMSAPDPADSIFAVEYKKIEKPSKKSRSQMPVILAGVVLLAGVLIVAGQSTFRKSSTPLPAAAPAKVEISKPIVPVSNTGATAPVETAPPQIVLPAPEPVVKEVPVDATIKEKVPPPVVPVVPGTLAVSSPTSTEIYQGDKFLGSTPTTLELPPGTHSLEYRHGDQRQFITHVIKSKETITTMVTFDVTVQINARPWAQVSIDGAQRRSLGQTPLSDIRVPIGSALIFENPNFPAKTYRVTGKETAIQIVFP
jgi:hypothetical protein